MMNKKYILPLMLASAMLVPSCANLADYNAVSPNEVGSVGQVIPGTVVASRKVRIDATASDKNLAMGIGAVAGAASGSLLGKGKGQIVSAAGGALAGGLAGRAVGKYANQADGQALTIRADMGGAMYEVIQPIYQGQGLIPVGTHGMLRYSGVGSRFSPDGY